MKPKFLDLFRSQSAQDFSNFDFEKLSIEDEWFRAHFVYASGVIEAWLGSVMKLEGARLLDFGCGDGITDLGVYLRTRPATLLGVDVRSVYEQLLAAARSQLRLGRLPQDLLFRKIDPGGSIQKHGQFDAIYTWSTFEHIDRRLLSAVIKDLHSVLVPGGWLFLQIEPLYFSPFGSHLGRFVSEPWAHLLMDGNELWAAVCGSEDVPGIERDLSYANQGLRAYQKFIFDEYLALNRLTADELAVLMVEAGFEIVRQERRVLNDYSTPPELLRKHSDSTLRTHEVLLLLKKRA